MDRSSRCSTDRLIWRAAPGWDAAAALELAQLRQLFPHVLSSEYLPDGSVDGVLCNELFEHLYDLPISFLSHQRLRRVRPNSC